MQTEQRRKSPRVPAAARGKSPAPRAKSPASRTPSKKASNKDVILWAAENVKPKHVTTRDVLGSLFLMTVPPLVVHILTFALRDPRINGSLFKLVDFVTKQGLVASFGAMLPNIKEIQEGSYYVVMFGFIQFLLMWIVPGHEHKGPIAPSGHVPVYKANGVQCFLLTIFLWAVGAYLKLFPAGWQYTYAPGMFAFLNMSALLLCVGLYFKGRFAPSTKDAGHSGNFIFDMFWGTELYPRFGHSIWPIGWDVKLWTNCRFGMMYWGLSGLSYAAAQYERTGSVSDSMMVSALVQVVYVLKFFWWEMGYMGTMDIQHDRAGFYICWGCLVWVPSLYTCHTHYLVHNPYTMGTPLTALLIVCGLAGVYINYEADAQKQEFRRSNGNCKIWGKKAEKIEAQYITADGVTKKSLLLLSGWWGLSRHFHYIPEWMAAFAWTAPTLYEGNVIGFTYFVFLVFLLLDRSFRDDARCRSKYNKYWDQYCKKVPYKIIPYIL
jgi:7-dehydrocholesterol reductase